MLLWNLARLLYFIHKSIICSYLAGMPYTAITNPGRRCVLWGPIYSSYFRREWTPLRPLVCVSRYFRLSNWSRKFKSWQERNYSCFFTNTTLSCFVTILQVFNQVVVGAANQLPTKATINEMVPGTIMISQLCNDSMLWQQGKCQWDASWATVWFRINYFSI